MLANIAILIGCFAVSATCVYVIIRNAAALGLIQIPLARSSHVKPTPAGGGVGIVIAACSAAVLLPGGGLNDLALLALALVVAIVGFIDDRHPLPARLRLIVQATAVIGAMLLTQPLGILSGGSSLLLMAAIALLLLISGVWWINLFNFMDGIDGIAGQQAVTMMVSAMTLSFLQDPAAFDQWPWWMMAIVTVATLGFLVFNWPPAKIFMGDAGSTFLGFIIVALAFQTLVQDWMTLPQWLLLALLFATDATTTLIVRFLGADRLSQAHRAHAYQRLSRRFGGARPVSTAAFFINLLILLPLAMIVPQGITGWCIALVAYGLAILVVLAAGCGLADDVSSSLQAYRARCVRLNGRKPT
ncbi:glycosyl transferase family 4 [Rhizobium sp. FKY42]|uniref:glycosyl transferase family 4 n=1 Tax=Rhizobium sp. FKY42 TaxID=2562310 RepID=UPI0010C10CD5|nr:glycosyl transferase family 4 [Rhizobium sp. FKY42]